MHKSNKIKWRTKKKQEDDYKKCTRRRKSLTRFTETTNLVDKIPFKWNQKPLKSKLNESDKDATKLMLVIRTGTNRWNITQIRLILIHLIKRDNC